MQRLIDPDKKKKKVRHVRKWTEPNEVLHGLKIETGRESDD
jgi:hypothetical protein